MSLSPADLTSRKEPNLRFPVTCPNWKAQHRNKLVIITSWCLVFVKIAASAAISSFKIGLNAVKYPSSRNIVSCTRDTTLAGPQRHWCNNLSWFHGSHSSTKWRQKSAAVCSPAPELPEKLIFGTSSSTNLHEKPQWKKTDKWCLQDVHHIHHQKKKHK